MTTPVLKIDVDEYADNYEFRGEDDYTPNEEERVLIRDALYGYESIVTDEVIAINDELDALKAKNAELLSALEAAVAWIQSDMPNDDQQEIGVLKAGLQAIARAKGEK